MQQHFPCIRPFSITASQVLWVVGCRSRSHLRPGTFQQFSAGPTQRDTFGRRRVAKSPNVHVFRLWEDAGVSGEKRRRRSENMQTPHRTDEGGIKRATFLPATASPCCTFSISREFMSIWERAHGQHLEKGRSIGPMVFFQVAGGSS